MPRKAKRKPKGRKPLTDYPFIGRRLVMFLAIALPTTVAYYVFTKFNNWFIGDLLLVYITIAALSLILPTAAECWLKSIIKRSHYVNSIVWHTGLSLALTALLLVSMYFPLSLLLSGVLLYIVPIVILASLMAATCLLFMGKRRAALKSATISLLIAATGVLGVLNAYRCLMDRSPHLCLSSHHRAYLAKNITGIDSEEQFTKLVAKSGDRLLAFDFSAVWCGPCKVLAPKLDEIAGKHKDKIDFYSIDIDKVSNVANTYGVTGLPTVVFIKQGKVLERMVGVHPDAHYIKAIEKHGQ